MTKTGAAGIRLWWGRMLCVCLVTWLAVAPLSAAVVHLQNGDRLTGTIVTVEADGLLLKTRWATEVKVPFNEIGKLEGTEVQVPAKPAVKPSTARSAAPATATKPKPPSVWKGDLRLGADLLFGERDQQIYTGRVKLTYARDWLRNTFDYLVTYGRTDGLVSANRMEGSSKTDFDLAERCYVYNLARAGYDEIRRIDLRYEIGPGTGYHIVRGKKVKLNAEVGSNYKIEQRSDGSSEEILVARMAEEFDWAITPRLQLEEEFEVLPEIEDWGNYRLRFETNVKYLLMGNVSLNVTLIDQYESRPARNVQQNDFQVRSSVGVVF